MGKTTKEMSPKLFDDRNWQASLGFWHITLDDRCCAHILRHRISPDFAAHEEEEEEQKRETTPEEAMWLGYVVSAKKEKKKEFSPFRRWWCGIFPTKKPMQISDNNKKIASYRRLMNERLLNVDRGRWGTFMSNNIVSKIWQLFREKGAGRSVILHLRSYFYTCAHFTSIKSQALESSLNPSSRNRLVEFAQIFFSRLCPSKKWK